MADVVPEVKPLVSSLAKRNRRTLPGWRSEQLRTTFWLVPCIMVLVAIVLFALTVGIDLAAHDHKLTLPFWVRTGSADAGRQVLIAIAAAVITVIGVVFSITILALTLASQQFGPRMMRNFMRDIGNQVTLGVFVGTFVYAIVTLEFITGNFVPHLSITVAEGLLLINLGVLIYFIHHIARSIQLPEVIARIADDLFLAIDTEFPLSSGSDNSRSDNSAIGSPRSDSGGALPKPGRTRGPGPGDDGRIPPIRLVWSAHQDRVALGRGYPPRAPSRPLRDRRTPDRHRVAWRCGQTDW